MPIQLIITGEHITDIFAEIQGFASAIAGEAPKGSKVLATSAVHEAVARGEDVVVAPVKTAESSAAKKEAETDKLSRAEQDAAVEEMIEAGAKDARYDLLTKGRQKNVDDGIAQKSKKEDALDDMFGGDEEELEEEVTSDTVRELMGRLGKDEDGNPVQENLVKIRDILTRFVPKGEEIKVGKIPHNKLKDVVAELRKMEA